MRRHHRFISAALVAGLIGMTDAAASAQPLGLFYWQLAPFCNVVALHITQHVTPPGAVYALTGFDDQCGAADQATLNGTAVFNHDGTIGIGLTIVTAPGGTPVHVDARVAVRSLSGPWTDSAGNAGTLVPLPRSQGNLLRTRASGLTTGSPRPVMPNGIAPGSITPAQLASGAIGAAQIAPGAVGVGQIDPQQVQARVSEGCPAGQYLRGINADGTVVCEPQAAVPRVSHAVGSYGSLSGAEGAETLVHSVTLAVPSAGTVLVHTSGNFELLLSGQQSVVRAQCSIALGTSVDAGYNADAVLTVSLPAAVQIVPFASTRLFDVTPGTFTANLICRRFLQGNAGISNPSLTALFLPAR